MQILIIKLCLSLQDEKESAFCSGISDSAISVTVVRRLLCLQNSPGKNTGLGGQSLLQEIFPTRA